MKRSIAIVFLLLAALVSPALSDVPELLSYQGVLTDGSGAALPDGSYNVAFRLYVVEAGGSPIWQEAHLVTVNKGIFNAILGWTQPLTSLAFDLPYYLGISIEGGPELTPRQLITNSAYAMNARMVKGSLTTANVLPDSGKVGIGTTNPTYALTVNSTGPEQVPIYANGNDAFWSSIYINALQPGATAGYGYLRQSVLKAYTGLSTADAWYVITGGGTRLRVASGGNVAIGDITPLEKLHVDGGLRIGNTSTTGAGTMRWTGTDFEGYDGSTWKSLTATGGGSLPPGTTGQTLWHNGTSWAATSSLYNNNSQIGIGTVDPEARLDIVGSSTQDIKVETSSPTGRATLSLQSTGGDLDYLQLIKHGPSAGGTTGGTIPLANLSRVTAGTSAGPLMLQCVSASPMFFVTSNLERMRLDASGNLGINTTAPGAKLHVDGNMWDLTNTEGDFKIGDATYRLKFGVATGGGGAGTAGIRVAGGAERLALGGGPAEVLSVDGAGNTAIGGPTSNAKLRLFRSGVDSAMVHAYTNDYGGNIDLFDETDNYLCIIESDVGGAGGFLAVYRDIMLQGFTVDGNYAGSNEPRVSIQGSARSAYFRMDQAGNASVVLPADAVGASEMLDEPGVASYTEGSAGTLLSAGAISTIASRSITIPAGGYVLVIGTAQLSSTHVTGTTNYCNIGVSDNAAAYPGNQDVAVQLPGALPSATYYLPASVHGLFSAASAGTYTYYLLGNPGATSQSWSAQDVQLTVLYIPTSYGTVMPTLAGAGASDDDSVPVAEPLSAAAIAAERTASEAANAARIERELAAMRAELEAVKAQLVNK